MTTNLCTIRRTMVVRSFPTSRANTIVLLWVTGICEAVKASCVSWACFLLLPKLKRRPPTLDAYLEGCSFYQWIVGDEMFDPLIMLFPYDPWKSVPYSEFVRWVPPPPNPLEMTKVEKVDAALRRLANPPRCHCGVSARLITPSQRGAFTTFYHCGLPYYVSSHETNLSLSLYAFCTYNVTLGTCVFLERVLIL
jgi:hypothetical protein